MENVQRNDETDSVVLGHSETQVDSAPIRIIKEVNPEDKYDMNHEKRGVAIIINQENFDDSELHFREGAAKDRDDVYKALENLQFEVQVLNDLTKTELFKKLEETAKKDHTNNDCLVVVVMTHGGPGVLYAKDRAYEIDKLWKKFTGDSCETLHGKPKLFFIHACSYEKSHMMQSDTVDSQLTTKRHTYTIPTMANLLVMYSTYDGNKSWRDTSKGSWFIQSLCAVLNSYGHSKELLRILTVVLRRVEKNYRDVVPDSEKTNALKKLPCIVSMLTKALYFRPKLLDNINIIRRDCNDLNNSRGLSNASATRRKRRREPPPHYTMQNMQRKAYIFHNQTFDECLNGKFLNSSNKDADELKSALVCLGFSVGDPSKDLTECELEEKMNSIASENHEDTGCVLFAIVTYGENNSLFAKDRKYPITKLWDRFSNTNCPTLSGKPKVFLIQAYTSGINNCSINHPPSDVLVMYSSCNEIGDSNDQVQLTPTVFIQTLCEEFYANGENEELNKMLENVRVLVANNNNQHNEQDPADGENREAILASNLSKILTFRKL